MIVLEKIERLGQVKEGDCIILEPKKPERGDDPIVRGMARKVKVTEYDGEEVIYNISRNRYFNVGMMLEGKSYVENAYILRKQPTQEDK